MKPLFDSADEWVIWYRDTFDLDAPSEVDVRGVGLANGLVELWARFLFETVLASGERGFSSFTLQWPQGRIEIQGEWLGAVRLRQWMYGEQSSSYTGYVESADRELLDLVAHAHLSLLNRQQSAGPLLELAAITINHDDFVDHLKKT